MGVERGLVCVLQKMKESLTPHLFNILLQLVFSWHCPPSLFYSCLSFYLVITFLLLHYLVCCCLSIPSLSSCLVANRQRLMEPGSRSIFVVVAVRTQPPTSSMKWAHSKLIALEELTLALYLVILRSFYIYT